jgi:hypothetical protein
MNQEVRKLAEEDKETPDSSPRKQTDYELKMFEIARLIASSTVVFNWFDTDIPEQNGTGVLLLRSWGWTGSQ